MRSTVAVRILGLLGALVVCAWFALGIRQAHDTDAATAIITASGPLSAAQGRHAADLLHSAGQLNPDRTVDLLRSRLALREGDGARARTIARAVTRAEPQNIDAWLAYGTASAHDPAGFAFALRHLNALAPPVPHGG